jgi:hypothetical protein
MVLKHNQARLTTRCSGAREAQFTGFLLSPFARPLNGSVRSSWRDRGEAKCHRCGIEEEADVEESAKENEA